MKFIYILTTQKTNKQVKYMHQEQVYKKTLVAK